MHLKQKKYSNTN